MALAALQKRHLAKAVAFAQLADDPAAHGGRQVTGEEDEEAVGLLTFDDDGLILLEAPQLAEHGQLGELSGRRPCHQAERTRHVRPSLQPVPVPGHLKPRQEGTDLGDALLNRRMALDQPPVLRFREPDALTGTRRHDVGHPVAALMADAPLAEGVGLLEPRLDHAAFLHRHLAVGDDEKVKGLLLPERPPPDNKRVPVVGADLGPAEQRL